MNPVGGMPGRPRRMSEQDAEAAEIAALRAAMKARPDPLGGPRRMSQAFAPGVQLPRDPPAHVEPVVSPGARPPRLRAFPSHPRAGEFEGAPRVSIHLPPDAVGDDDWESPCTRILKVAWATSGTVVKTLLCVVASRTAASAVHDALVPQVVMHMPAAAANPEDAAGNGMGLVLGAVLVHMVVCDIVVRPSLSAMLTWSRNEKVVRAGGCGHRAMVRALAQLPTVFTLVLAVREAWDLPGGVARNMLVFTVIAAAGRTALYVLLRGVFERIVARVMPARSIVDAEGDPVPSELMAKSMLPRAACMLPFTIANAGLTADNILRRGDYSAGPFGPYIGGSGAAVNMWIGVYEVVAAAAEWMAIIATARTQGWSVVISDPSERPAAPHAAAPVTAVSALINSSSELEDEAREVVAGIHVRRCGPAARMLPADPPPHVFRDVMGFRLFGNLLLNAIMSDEALEAMEASGMPFGAAGWLGLTLGIIELAPLLIERGIHAQVSEGTADRELFDMLHRLFRLQDGIHRRRIGRHPDEGTPIIDRELDPAIMALIDGHAQFAPVQRHMKELKRAHRRERLAARMDPASDRLVFFASGPYPTAAMREAFATIRASDPPLKDSRVATRSPQAGAQFEAALGRPAQQDAAAP